MSRTIIQKSAKRTQKPAQALKERAKLQDLPIELLLDIHLQCASPVLPLLCRHLRNVFARTSVEYRAIYLLRAVAASILPHVQLERIVTFPICTEEVYDKVLAAPGRYWELMIGQRAAFPRRLCKRLTHRTPVDGLLNRLIRSEMFDVNGNKGYALSRAVFVKHDELIDTLLQNGADASTHNNMAIIFAIRRMDLDLVRRLIDADSYNLPSLPPHLRKTTNRQMWLPDEQATKLIDEAFKAGDMEIVDYLRGLGATPSMDALRLIQE